MTEIASSVMVIDGSPQILSFMALLLGGEGYQVHTAETLEEVERALETARPDLVVADPCLPGLRPFAVVDHLDAVPRTRGLPLILCTAATHELQRAPHRLRRPRTEVLVKPFDLDELFTCIARLIAAGDRTQSSHSTHG